MARVSPATRAIENQSTEAVPAVGQDALDKARVDKSYEDKASGKSLDRPQLAECLRSLRKGDTLIVWRLDRLGRSVKDLVALIN